MDTRKKLNVLSLEDSVYDYEMIREQLTDAGFALDMSRVEKEHEFTESLRSHVPDMILADFKLPGFDVFSALQISNEICPDVPFICVSGLIGEETAIELLKLGAEDYVIKDRIGRLPLAIQRALDDAAGKRSRRQAEAALRESEQNYKTLADSGLTLVWASGMDKLFNYFNRVWLEFTGRTVEQEMGMGWTESVHPDDLPGCWAVYTGAFDRLEKFSMEFRLRRYDNEYRWMQNDGCPRYSSQGECIGYIGHCLDITHLKQSELILSGQNEELQKLNAEKDKYFSIIAHDLRGPFNAFLGFTRMMEEELSTFTLDELQKIASSMRKSATMLFQLLENLLEWSRLQRGLGSFTPEAFLVKDVIAPGIELLHDVAEKKRIRIVLDIPEMLGVTADAPMFESLMRNLVFNAIKFTPKEGVITIRARSVPGNAVEISVRDTGIGMSQNILDKLFSLNEHILRKGTDGEPSTGLGLLLCKDFVERHGGKIWADSVPGKGSEFHFTLAGNTKAAETPALEKAVALTESTSPDKKLKILIAEDDETSEMLITLAVRTFSNEVLVAHNGLEALEACRSHSDIDLIMMDVKMPEMDGYEATRRIRQFNKNVVIIAQTAFGLTGDSENAKAAGCSDYISKPLNIALLKDMIHKYCLLGRV